MPVEPSKSEQYDVQGNLVGSTAGGGSVTSRTIAGRDNIEVTLVQQINVHLDSLEDLPRLYQQSLPSTFEGERDYEGLKPALDTLWQVVDSDNRRSGYAGFLLNLIEQVKDRDEDLARELLEQLQQLSRQPESRLPQMEAETALESLRAPAAAEASTLLIEIEPRKLRGQAPDAEFRVRFYPWKDGAPWETYFEETWMPLDEIPGHIETVINGRYSGAISTIELFVPIEVLVHHSHFDQAETQDDLGQIFEVSIVPKRFGSARKIVLRSRERQRTRLRRDLAWRNKWHHLKQCQNVYDLIRTFSLETAEWEAPLRSAWPSDRTKTMAVLHAINQDAFETRLRKILSLLFGAGVPVIVWSRKVLVCSGNDDEAELNMVWEQCHDKDYKYLWRLLHKLRREEMALTDATYIGNHITLVWDTPERMLPKKNEFGEQQ